MREGKRRKKRAILMEVIGWLLLLNLFAARKSLLVSAVARRLLARSGLTGIILCERNPKQLRLTGSSHQGRRDQRQQLRRTVHFRKAAAIHVCAFKCRSTIPAYEWIHVPTVTRRAERTCLCS